MAKQEKPRCGPAPRKKPTALEIAARTIETLAKQHNTTQDMVRKHIQVSMMNGLISEDPAIKEAWARIPRAGDVPTPEEVIAYYAARLSGLD